MRPAILVCLILGGLASGCAGAVHGVVFIDKNHDGIHQKTEPIVPNAMVTLDRGVPIRTDAKGQYGFLTPEADGVVWVRVPDGFRPGPVWKHANDLDTDLPLIPLTEAELASPLTFVVAADTHSTTSTGSWDGGDLDDAFAQALGMATPPRFFTIVGDVTQSNKAEEFARVDDTLKAFAIPFISVPGNHDWYDNGVTWRQRMGPDNYSFDVGNLHVVVWDTNLTEPDQVAFFANDLAGVEQEKVIVALGHASPSDVVADQLSELGVDYMFTGHWHANRRVERTNLVEWGTQTMVMGTIDQSPSGYRIVTFVDGVPTVEHRARIVEPHVAVTSPNPGSCASPAGFQLLVSAALDASVPTVRARIDCGEEVSLTPIGAGGWSFGMQVGALAMGTHSIDVTATAPSGRKATQQIAFQVCPAPTTARVAADWLQLGGSATHTGATATPITPPLVQSWATSIGGNVLLGTPVIRGNTVVVAVWDLAAGDQGGLVALDLTTGAERWRYVTKFPVHSSPAIGTIASGTPPVDEDLVVVALENGELHGVSLATGQMKWTRDIAEGLDSLASSLWASPTIADGVVYAAVQGRMSAVSLADGQPVWTHDRTPEYPWLGSLAAVAVSGGVAIANYARTEGMTAWSVGASDLGSKRWELTGAKTVAINSTPVIDGDVVYYINAASEVTAADLATSRQRWSRSTVNGAGEWNYAVTAAPAIANGRLFVPTQYNVLQAIDTATGNDLWHHVTESGPLNFVHYRATQAGFPASPVVTGDVVWVPHPDGKLVALAAGDGHELWSTSLGAPLVSAPAPAGDYLIAATFDGTVHAFVADLPVTPQLVPSCNPAEPGDATTPILVTASGSGCCNTSTPTSSTGLLASFVVLVLARRRRCTTSRVSYALALARPDGLSRLRCTARRPLSPPVQAIS